MNNEELSNEFQAYLKTSTTLCEEVRDRIIDEEYLAATFILGQLHQCLDEKFEQLHNFKEDYK